MSVRRGTIAIFLSTILRNLLSFGAVAYFSRSSGIAALGSFFLFQSLLSLLSKPADLGMRVGVEKRLSEGSEPGPIIASALLFKFGLFAVCSLSILALDDVIASYVGADIAPLVVIGLILNELGMLGVHTLRGEHRVTETAFFEPLRTGLWFVVGALLVEIGFGITGLLLSYLIGLLAVAIVAAWRIDSSLGWPSVAHMRSLFGYSKFAALGSIGGTVYNWADIVLIGIFLSQAAVGAYEVAWRVATASLLLSNAVRTAIFPQANDWGASGDLKRLELFIESAFVPSFYFVIPAFVGVLVYGQEILSIIFAVSYPGLALVLAILMIEKLQRAVLFVLIAPMHAIGRVDAAAYTTLAGVVANIVLNVALIPRYGIIGAAIGTAIGALVNTTTHMLILSINITISVPKTTLAWCSFSAILMGGALITIDEIIKVQTTPRLIIAILIAGGVYIGLTAASPSIREELADNAQSILS